MAKTTLRFLTILTKILSIACAIAVIFFSAKLLSADSRTAIDNPSLQGLNDSVTCLLEESGRPRRTCIYGISVGAIAFIITMVLSCLMCVTCGCCGLGGAFGAIGNIALVVWFGIGASVLVPRAVKANNAGLPEKDNRVGVIIALIGGAVVNGVGAFAEIAKLFSS